MPLQRHAFGMQRFVTRQWYSSGAHTSSGFFSVHCSSTASRQSMMPSHTDDLVRQNACINQTGEIETLESIDTFEKRTYHKLLSGSRCAAIC